MSGHTKRPWEVRGQTVDGTFMVLGGEGGEFGLIADVTLEDDANLIAAAPELLAALKLARERMLGSSPTLAALRAQTDAALRKAQGQTAKAVGGEL